MRRRPYAHAGNLLHQDKPTVLSGRRDGLTSGVIEDIHRGPTPRAIFLDVPAQIEVVALAGGEQNTLGGTGVQTLRVWTLGPDYEYLEQVIEMNGLTPVLVPGGPFLRCNFLQSETVGSNEYAVGADIIARTTIGGQELRRLPVGENRPQDGAYTVPADERMQFSSVFFSLSDQKANDIVSCTAEFRAGPGLPWVGIDTVRQLVELDPVASTTPRLTFMVPPRADIRFTALAGVVGVNVGMRAVFIF